ncbi:uncharacterized protein LOC123307427 [Coccinella septempunctata]|uniref:uncharacterized protein LOC123307427 n=1 Tax=Coccinella septempunctata TaxID=41139 RepID=UPI001D066CF0|nr:uncharacterized protein LOC123307427 [Coccinella septempunctata]
MSEKKFNRGKNFSIEEKNLLFSIIESKKDIIECKATNKISIIEKKECWEQISRIFNALAIEKRSAAQLKTLYENSKRRAKQEIGSENKERFLHFPQSPGDIEGDVVWQEDPKEAEFKKMAIHKKDDIYKTDEGTFKTSSKDEIVPSLIEDVKPFSNPFDSAAVYFGDANLIPNPNDLNSHSYCASTRNTPICSNSPQNVSPPKTFNFNNRRKFRRFINLEAIKKMYYLQKLNTAKLQHRIVQYELKMKKKEYELMMNNHQK